MRRKVKHTGLCQREHEKANTVREIEQTGSSCSSLIDCLVEGNTWPKRGNIMEREKVGYEIRLVLAFTSRHHRVCQYDTVFASLGERPH